MGMDRMNQYKQNVVCKECGGDWVIVYARRVKDRTSYGVEYYIHCYQCNKTDWIGIKADQNEKKVT